MSESETAGWDWSAAARACRKLLTVSLRRQLCSRQSLVGLALGVVAALIVLAWAQRRGQNTERLAEQMLIPIYMAFLMPVLAICYGASSIGGEREDRTLIFLLITPIPRPLIYLTKFLASILLVTAWSAATLAVLCLVAGEPGRDAWKVFWFGSLLGATAYASLFQLLGALFRHGTIISLAYWFFLEVLFGNLPGIINRLSIAFYVRCMIYEQGAQWHIAPIGPGAQEMFNAVSGGVAAAVLAGATVAWLLLGAAVFAKREYRDLS